MGDTILKFVMIGYFLMGFIQIFAIIGGVKSFLNVGIFIALIISGIIAYIPLIGPIAGVYGAIKIWHWHWAAAILLFFWPYALALGISLLTTTKVDRD